MDDNRLDPETLRQLYDVAHQAGISPDALLKRLLATMVVENPPDKFSHLLTETMISYQQTLEALRESETKYRLLFQEAPIAIWKQDCSGMKSFLDNLRQSGITDLEAHLQAHPELVMECLRHIEIRRANNIALQMYHAPSIEAVQDSFYKLVVPHDPQQVASLMAMADGKPSFAGEFINKTLTGETIYLWLKWLVIPGHEKTYNQVLFVTLDITEQKHYHNFIIESERMAARFRKEQEHNTLIQRSVSALAHDLRTPLSVIGTSKDLLLKYFDKLTEEKRKEKLESIGRQLEFAMELLDDTVMMVSGALNERLFHPSQTHLATLCQVSIDEVGTKYRAGRYLHFTDLGHIGVVLVDEILVSRILLNLLSNAIKYTPQHKNIHLELDSRDDKIMLRVRDNGIGIHLNNLPQIFEPFYRAPEVKHIDGTGLGLSIVKECVERHQGQIMVESEVGKGTTFTVELPLMVATDRIFA